MLTSLFKRNYANQIVFYIFIIHKNLKRLFNKYVTYIMPIQWDFVYFAVVSQDFRVVDTRYSLVKYVMMAL